MKHIRDPKKHIAGIKSYILFGALLWTAIIGASLLWNFVYTKGQTLSKSDVMARLAFDKDTSFRSWLTFHGGAYVPVTDETAPNPYLDVPERDVTLQSGKPLTLMNPAYAMRQYYEKFDKKGSVKGHITSLKPLRPINIPDPWEEQSLRDFEIGKKEAVIIQVIDEEEYVRFMKPFITVKGCLKCHASQGYKEGEIRGGVSVSVPMVPLRKLEGSQLAMLLKVHLLIWGFGLAGIAFMGNGIIRSERQRVSAEDALRVSEEKLAKVFQASPDWITISTLEDGRYIDVNDAFVYMTGYRKEEAIGKTADELGLWVNGEQRISALELLEKNGVLHNFEVELRMKSGKIHTMLWSAEKIELKGQRYLVNAVNDITNRKAMEREIKHIAYHDMLTGIPNRILLLDRLSVAINQAERNQNRVALMMLDLDKFKDINDNMGHHAGDLLLKGVAERLMNIVRKEDTVARFGGDEFVLVLTQQKDREGALEVARKIVDSFQAPFPLNGHTLSVTTSVGIAFYPDDGKDIDTILKNADTAMYIAKAAGRNGCSLFGASKEGKEEDEKFKR
ncbi:MAG: hypothetical protein C0392_05335 [Syntrophus sp. (in: bacteria)]|nr:hypothetical protein [Syntrophus sp. (in: bacteria)]